MNYENLKKFFSEISDIVFREKITVMLFIIAFALIHVVSYFYSSSQDDFGDFRIAAVEGDRAVTGDNIDLYHTESPSKISYRQYPFDPNTASYNQLLELGFPTKVANILINYREKGGKFFKREDIKKVYGLTPEFYRKIESSIQITPREFSENSSTNNHPKQSIMQPIDINIATPEDFESLYGIGKYYANKIVNFRSKLGGFYSVDQVAETYGFPDSSFQKIKPFLTLKNTGIKKININSATFEELDAHPYIAKWQAEDIIKNRPIYGLEDLYEVYSFKNREKNKRLEPYIDFK